MRKFLVVFVLLPFCVSAQRPESRAAFEKSIPPGLGRSLSLPDPGYREDFPLDDVFPYEQKQRLLVVRSDSLYRVIFSGYAPDDLPVIDFNCFELVLYAACGQCLAHCAHDKGASFCHRNVCRFEKRWFLRERGLHPDF